VPGPGLPHDGVGCRHDQMQIVRDQEHAAAIHGL